LACCTFTDFSTKHKTQDVVLCNTILSCCEKGSQWLQSLHILTAPNGLKATVVSFGAVIGNCEKSSQWHWAIQLLSKLTKKQLEANVTSLK